MNINDKQYALLKEEGYTGSYSDMLYKKLRDLTGLQGATNDMWYEWLKGLGYEGSVNDMLYQHLTGKGYTGTVNDLLLTSNDNRDLFYANEGMVSDFDLMRYITQGSATTFDSLYTFTRSSITNALNSAGVYAQYAINEPAFQYERDVLKQGILFEEQRTNLVSESYRLEQPYWAKLGSSIDVTLVPSPLGAHTARKIVDDTTTGAHRIISGAINISTTGEHSLPFLLKRDGRRYAYVRFNGAGGDYATASVDLQDCAITENVTGAVSVKPLSDGWCLVQLVGNVTTTGNSYVEIRNSTTPTYSNYTGDGTSGILIAHAQLEQGTFPTSPIITEGSTVTRAAPSCVIDDLSKIGFNASEGTFEVEFSLSQISDTQHIFDLSNGLSGERFVLYLDANGNLFLFIASGGINSNLAIGSVTENTLYNVKCFYGGTTFGASVNGGNTITGSFTNLPLSVNQFRLGAIYNQNTILKNGIITKATYTPRATL